MIFSSPAPLFGQCWKSMSKTRLSSRAQLMRPSRAWAVSTSHSEAAAVSVAGPSCSSGLCGTSAARHCMNRSGLITKWGDPSRHGVFSFSSTWPAALSLIRSSESVGRVM